jgi:hypothetical protein
MSCEAFHYYPSLHPQTQAVFAAMSAAELTLGFLLIGGSALALHIGHRMSNALDFIFTYSIGKLRIRTVSANELRIGRTRRATCDQAAPFWCCRSTA